MTGVQTCASDLSHHKHIWSLLKIILGGSKYVCDGKTLVSQLCSKKDCYIAKVGYCDEARRGILNSANGIGVSSEVAFELLSEALNVLEVDDSMYREPIILVLDYEVQVSELFPTLLLCSYEISLSIKFCCLDVISKLIKMLQCF